MFFFFSYANHNDMKKHLSLYIFSSLLWKNRNVKRQYIIKKYLFFIQVITIWKNIRSFYFFGNSIIIFINMKFRIAKIILLKCRSSSSKRNIFLATINNWKKNFLWLKIESEMSLLSGLFCKFVWNTNANRKVLEGMMANLFP